MREVKIYDAVHEHDCRAPERVEDDADQQQRERLELAVNHREPINRDSREKCRAKCAQRDGRLATADFRRQHERENRAECAATGDSEDAALGQRIAHEGLQSRSNCREHRADDHSHQYARQSGGEKNRVIGTVGIRKRAREADMRSAEQ